MSDCAIIGSGRVDVKPIIEIGGGLNEGERSGRSCPARSSVGSKYLGSSLSVVGRKRRMAKTLPANLDLDFQNGIGKLDVVEV